MSATQENGAQLELPLDRAASAGSEESAQHVQRLQKEIADLRREAADRRIAARTAEAEAAAAKNRVADLEPYEAAAREEMESLRHDLGDKARVVDGLTQAQALRVLRTLKAAAQGPAAAHLTTAGNPAPASAGQPDVSRMNPQDLRQYIHELPIAEVRKLAEQHGLAAQGRNVFG